MSNIDMFNLIVCDLFSKGQEVFPLPLEASFKDFFKGDEPFLEASVFQYTLKWLEKNGYITVTPPVSDKTDDYLIEFTEKSLQKWGMPSSISGSTVIDVIKSASKTCTKEAFKSAIRELVSSVLR